jgi:hypothetical protein
MENIIDCIGIIQPSQFAILGYIEMDGRGGVGGTG